jgi:hypothetical protein
MPLSPQLLDERVGGYDLSGTQHEQGEKRPVFLPGQRQGVSPSRTSNGPRSRNFMCRLSHRYGACSRPRRQPTGMFDADETGR